MLTVINVTEGQSRLPRVRCSRGQASWDPGRTGGTGRQLHAQPCVSNVCPICICFQFHLNLGAKVKHFFP